MGSGSSQQETQQMLAAKEMCKSAIKDNETATHPEDEATEIFKKWDVDGNGSISKAELFAVFEALGLFSGSDKAKKKAYEKLLDEMDTDLTGCISYAELIAFVFQGPYLKKYLEESRVVLVDNNRARVGVTGDKLQQLIKKQSAELEKQLTPWIKKSFDFHDKDGSGKLEKGESIIFFCNYIGIVPKLHSHVIAHLEEGSVADTMKSIDIFEHWQASLKDREMLDKRFKAAFALLDKTGDGRLEQPEVVAALLHGSEKNLALMKALEVPVSW
jgi:Ca2+-binding EF-hand superfamily protein